MVYRILVMMNDYDIEAASRVAIDPPGAYAAGNVRKGSFF